jgi:hypothetical protein
MTSMNFFNWIREGVRHAVLLGVSEAVESIGTPPNGDDMGHHLLEVLRGGRKIDAPPQYASLPGKRKKLGRTLNDIQGNPERSP